jgi:Protein of unknown function (DUF1622)
LVAADIVKTIAHGLTFMRLGLLAGLVLVRTFLSWPLVLEIEVRWPWQREPSLMSSRARPGGNIVLTESGVVILGGGKAGIGVMVSTRAAGHSVTRGVGSRRHLPEPRQQPQEGTR